MKVVRSSELEWAKAMEHGAFGGRRKPLGGERMSCSVWELLPGKKSFPMHKHYGTEEALYAISGRAKVRTPDGETPLGPGDYVSFPAGGVAHQLINDGTEPFIYLGISSSLGLDVVEYPDSGKVACAVGGYPPAKRFIFKENTQAGYWDGES